MKIVVDTNIIFSAILNADGKIGDLLMNSQEIFSFFSSEFLRQEIDKYKDKLIRISGLTEEEIEESKYQIFNCVTFISEIQIPFDIWHESARLVRDVDMNDIAFVALSEYLDSILWTGDKELRKGLNAKGYNKIISTGELFDLRKKVEEEK